MSQPKNAAVRRGFTLMELLVVVAIISVLIAFLLPALSEARRGANKVKCLAALRDLHNAFNMYAVEFQQAWPVVQHVASDSKGSPSGDKVLPAYTASPEPKGGERHWADLIAKYAGHQKVVMTYYKDLGQLKNRKSVIWGCPEWENNLIWTGKGEVAYSPGFGMSFNANPEMYLKLQIAPPVGPGTATVYESMAWLSVRGTPTAVRGAYAKTSIWGKRSSDKLLLADSQYYFVGAFPPSPNDKVPETPTGQFGCTFNGYAGAPTYDVGSGEGDMYWSTKFVSPGFKHFYIDGGRHAKSGQTQYKLANVAGTNVLFADGHAATVTPREAYVAFMFPGKKP